MRFDSEGNWSRNSEERGCSSKLSTSETLNEVKLAVQANSFRIRMVTSVLSRDIISATALSCGSDVYRGMQARPSSKEVKRNRKLCYRVIRC